jgi:glycosyltransferase involved in cell wall biosynthesis
MNGTPSAPERIPPVDSQVDRPFWSVMIPTYNCAKYLVKTLESVLEQDPGPAQMQVEVVDDVSTKDDPEAVVREIGKGRVLFFRQPTNVGPTPNFNVCLRRSRGHWVHILHGDDFVLPGFYAAMRGMIDNHAPLTLACSRFFFCDASAEIETLSPRVTSLEEPSNDVSFLFGANRLGFAATVIKREFVEVHGGFQSALIHTADWEMWVRCISRGRGIMKNAPFAGYRVFGENHTSQLMRTGENVRDDLRFGYLLAAEHNNFDLAKFKRDVAAKAMGQAKYFGGQQNEEAARANFDLWRTLWTPQTLRERLRCRASNIKTWLRGMWARLRSQN